MPKIKQKDCRVLCLTCGMMAQADTPEAEINSALALCRHANCEARQLSTTKEELPADLSPQSAPDGVGAAAEAVSSAYTGGEPEEGKAGSTP